MLVKLPGDVHLDPATGRITTVFDNLPQVPFTSFALTFQGGSHAVLANPAACGVKQVSALLTPWSGTAPKTAVASDAATSVQRNARRGDDEDIGSSDADVAGQSSTLKGTGPCH